jgi:hypothetical protein
MTDDLMDLADSLTQSPASGSFTLPDTRVPLRFGEGEHRLVGAVRLGDGPPRPGHPGPPKPTPFPPPPTT